jgi:hypothetical protein
MNTDLRFVIRQDEQGNDLIVGPFPDEDEAAAYARRLRDSDETNYRLLVGKRAPVTLDTNKARTLLREIVNSPEFGPEYVYRKDHGGTSACVNWTCKLGDGEDSTYEPSCLIGQLWFRLGFDQHVIPETSGSTGVMEKLVPADLLYVPEGDPLEAYLSMIQQRQDSGSPWGECLVEGDRRLVEMISWTDSMFASEENIADKQGLALAPITRDGLRNALSGAFA